MRARLAAAKRLCAETLSACGGVSLGAGAAGFGRGGGRLDAPGGSGSGVGALGATVAKGVMGTTGATGGPGATVTGCGAISGVGVGVGRDLVSTLAATALVATSAAS